MKISPKESVNLCYGEHQSTKRCGVWSRRQRTGIRTVLSCENDGPWRYGQLHLPLRKSSALARASRQADSSQPASESRPYGNCCNPHVHLSPTSTSSIPDSPPAVTEHRGQGPGALITTHLLSMPHVQSRFKQAAPHQWQTHPSSTSAKSKTQQVIWKLEWCGKWKHSYPIPFAKEM